MFHHLCAPGMLQKIMMDYLFTGIAETTFKLMDATIMELLLMSYI